MTAPKIEYRDNGKVARDKINAIIDEVEASIPSIGENGHWYIGGVDTGISAVGLELREENNLIKQNASHETYTDLQFSNGLTPTSVFPIGVTVGNVSSNDGWLVSGIMMNSKTENTYCRILFGDDDKLYIDGGLGVFKDITSTEYVDEAISRLRSELSRVAFTGLSSDLDNDAEFTSDKVLTWREYEDTSGTSSDDRRYVIYKNK